jgi:DNA (cytosine-5)-methyltransferase 1
MKFLSVCSGIEAASVAWNPLGWEAVGFSEIDPFPCQVLKHRYPQVTNFGDMTQYRNWSIDEPVDLLVGGTPCQSFSVAGLRKGIDDPRGNLMLTFLGIADKFSPEWIVWENVPGVLSSNGGRDFGTFLGALAELGYFSAYRVFDARFFGVPQRRRRVFVIANRTDWRNSAAVLFDREMLPRDHQTVDRKEGTAWWDGKQVSQTLDAVLYKGQMLPEKNRFPVIAVGEKLFSPQTATKTGIVQTATLTMASVPVLDLLKKMNMSTVSSEGSCGRNVLRRLTEIECERLQGFPDDHTKINDNTPTGPRLKAIGNSMPVPVMHWIGQGIDQIHRRK